MRNLFRIVEDSSASDTAAALWCNANRKARRRFQHPVVSIPTPSIGGRLILVHEADLPSLAEQLCEAADDQFEALRMR